MPRKIFSPQPGIAKALSAFKDGNKNNVTVLPCIIRKVYHNLLVDVYVPYSSSILTELPFIYNGFSENQGDVVTPEENSLALLLFPSDGKRLVFGGTSFAENYVVRNILPGESERYIKSSSYKQDLRGGHIFSTDHCATMHFSEDGVLSQFGAGQSFLSDGVERLQICFKQGECTYHGVTTNYYVSLANHLTTEEKHQQFSDGLMNLIVSTQNLREEYSEEDANAFSDYCRQQMRSVRRLNMTVEEGLCLTTPAWSAGLQIDNAIATDNHGERLIYRRRIFDANGNAISSYAISETGNVSEEHL